MGTKVYKFAANDLEAALEEMRTYTVKQHHRMSWCVLVEVEDGLELHQRFDQPCYGEMREYRKTHPNLLPESQRSVRKPSDLHSPFPDGKPIALACSFFSDQSNVPVSNHLLNAVLDPSFSPWRGVLTDFELVQSEFGPNNEKLIVGIVIKDLNIDPTLMVNMFMFLRYVCPPLNAARFKELTDEFPDEDPYVLLTVMVVSYVDRPWVGGKDEKGVNFLWNDPRGYGPGRILLSPSMSYVIASNLDIKSFLKGIPNPEISEGGTFAQRYAYNRPRLHEIFGTTKDSFNRQFKELTGIENAQLEKSELIHLVSAIKTLAA